MTSQTIQNIRVFVAAPGDLQDVRNTVDQVCNELNQTWRILNKRLDVLHWRDVTFFIGSPPETTILEQMNPNDWDIFIGVFWHRFGTSTGDVNPSTGKSYRSGTEQEFFTALEELRKRNLPMLFYRRDTPISPSQIDANQLKLVQKFYKGFGIGGSQKGFIHQFDTLDELKQYLRRDLSLTVQRLY